MVEPTILPVVRVERERTDLNLPWRWEIMTRKNNTHPVLIFNTRDEVVAECFDTKVAVEIVTAINQR